MAFYYPFLGGGRTCNQITTPLVYDESLSVAQQIACLFGKIKSMDTDFVSTDEFKEFINQLNVELDKIKSDAERILMLRLQILIISSSRLSSNCKSVCLSGTSRLVSTLKTLQQCAIFSTMLRYTQSPLTRWQTWILQLMDLPIAV